MRQEPSYVVRERHVEPVTMFFCHGVEDQDQFLFDRGMAAFSPVEQSVVRANVCRKVVWTSNSGCPDVLSD